MTNPLIEKYNNLRSPKGEKPKEEEVKQSPLTPIDPVLNGLTRANPYPPLDSLPIMSPRKVYAYNNLNGHFLDIARKVESAQAQVTNVKIEFEHYPYKRKLFHISVEMCDDP